jgi:hypothetical protein
LLFVGIPTGYSVRQISRLTFVTTITSLQGSKLNEFCMYNL